ncbi:hypothetical protein GS506_19205 [Rhodococcus hoagii]|nr:hypothetical protein [Prescottella equi]
MGDPRAVCDGDIDVPSAEEDSPTPVNIRFGLKDVVKCRNDIAHGDISRKPTEDDVERYARFLSTLANRMQRKSEALISSIVPPDEGK